MLIQTGRLTPQLAEQKLASKVTSIPLGTAGKPTIQALSLEPLKSGEQTRFSRNIAGQEVDIVRGSPTAELSSRMTAAIDKGIRVSLVGFLKETLTDYSRRNPSARDELTKLGVKFNSRGDAIPSKSMIDMAMSHGNLNLDRGPLFERGIIGLGAKPGPKQPGKAAPIDTMSVGQIVADIMSQGQSQILSNLPTEIRTSTARTRPSSGMPKKGGRGLINQIFRFLKLPGVRFNDGGMIQNFANGDYVEGSALKALKQLTRDFLMPKSRKGGRRKISFVGQQAVSISKNISPELLKQIEKEGRLVYGTGMGSLAKGDPGLIVDKIINVALAKTQKQKEGKLKKTQGALTLSAAGLQRGPRAPKGQMEKALAKYQQDPEYRKAMGLGGSADVLQALSAFRKSGGKTSLSGVFSDSAVAKIEKGIPEYIATLGDEPQKIAKAKTAQQYLRSFAAGATANKAGHATAFSETINQMLKSGIIKELAQGGYISYFSAGGLNKGISSNRAKEAILGRQLNGMEMMKAANKVGYKLSERDDGLIEFIKNGKITHTLSRKEASELLGSLTTGSYKLGGEIPIMAQKGEYVINKQSAQSIGYNNLHKLNKYHTGGIVGQGAVSKFAAGGIVGGLGRILSQLTDTIRRFSTNIARVPSGRGWLGGRPIPGMPATGMGSRAAARGRTPGMIPEDMTRSSRLQNSAFALSMALPVINEMMQGNREASSASEASNRAFTGTLSTGLGGSLALASMGGIAGPIGAVVVGLGSFVKAIADSQDAIREFNVKDATDKLNNQLENTSKSLDKFDKDINNANTRTKALADVLSTISKAESVTSASQDRRVGVFNLLDTAQADATGRISEEEQFSSFKRSVILFDRGISDYLQTLSFFSDAENARANEAALFAKSIPKLAKERATGFGGASEASTRLLENEIKRSGSLDALRANKVEFEKLTSSLALADVQVQEQILRVKNNNNLDDTQKKTIIEGIIARAGENKAIEIANRAMREKAIDDLNKAASKASFSLELMFTEMEQSINASNFSIDKLRESSELAAASLSGQAKIGQTRLNAINILQNPRAYSSRENIQASSLGASAFGAELEPAIQGLLRFGPMLQDTVMSTINQVLTTTPKQELNNEVIAAKISRAVRQSLDRLQLPPELAAKLSNEVGKQIEELRQSGEDKVDFSQLMEKIPALASVVDSAKRAQESAIQALENWQKNLNTYSDAFNRITELQIQNNERLRRSSDILFQGQLELAKAFGQPTDLRGVINNFNAGIASMSGGFTSVGDIMKEIQDLERIRQQQQNLQNDAANRGQQGTQAFAVMTDNLKNTNVKLRESYNALEQLSQSSEIAAAAMGRIAELQQKQQAGIGIMEKLVTSTPEELNNFGNALQRLQVNMMGVANYGTTAEQRGESLQAFNMIAPLLGGMEGGIKANVLESMLREANAPLTPFFSQILDSLRNPAADPEMKQAIDIYNASLQQQIAANNALTTLNNRTIRENADFAAKQITAGFEGALQNFESRQLANIASNISEILQIFKNRPAAVPVQAKASGGMIYANNGMFVPKGSDTVPAMLTPGEFVVNKKATQQNLPLLKSINNGTKGYSRGGVAYLANGGLVSLYDNAENAIGGKDFEPADQPKVSTDQELYAVPMDIKNILNKSFEDFKAIEPVYFANAIPSDQLKPLGTFLNPFGDTKKQIQIANNTIGSSTIQTRASTIAPPSISMNLSDWTTQDSDKLYQSTDIDFQLPTAELINQLSTIKTSKITATTKPILEYKLSRYKNLYDDIIDYLSVIKYGESFMEFQGNKVFSSVLKPDLKPRASFSGNTIRLKNLATFGTAFIGPIPKTILDAGTFVNEKSPLGWATAVGFPSTAISRFNVVAGSNNIGGYNSVTGAITSVGNKIYGKGYDIQDYVDNNTNKQILTNLASSVPNIIDKTKKSLDDLDSIKIIPSDENKRSQLIQKRLNALYNNQKFSDTFTPPDIAGKESISLYNIRDENEWNKILPQVQNFQNDVKPGENIATNKASWYRLFSGAVGLKSVALPWTKGFPIESDILKATEEKFKKAQDFIKESKLETYKDKNLMFNYQKIKGYLFDEDAGAFDISGGPPQEFITVPLGGEAFAQNPFSGAQFDNKSRFGYFDKLSQLELFINKVLQETTKQTPNDSISLPNIFKAKDISTFGTFPQLAIDNAFLKGIPPDIDLSLIKFIEEYNKSKRIRDLDQPFKLPAAAGPAGNLFDLLKTPKNLFDISSGTLRSPDILRIGGGLGYRLDSLKNPNQLGLYVQYLNNLISRIDRDPRGARTQNYRGGSYKKYNENFVKLYSKVEAARDIFQSIAGNDIGSLSRLIGKDASGLAQNGVLLPNSINEIIQSIHSRAMSRTQAILTGGAAQPILSQTTTALDDILKTDREAIETANIGADGTITGYGKVTEQAAKDKTVQQVGKLALNPYTFFKDDTRKNLIDNSIITAIDNQIRNLRTNKRAPKDLLRKTYGIKNDVNIVKDWFSGIHDKILNVKIDEGMIQAGDLKNQIDQILDGTGDPNTIDSNISRLAFANYDLSNKALSRLTGGTFALDASGVPTPLLDFDRMLDLLIARKNIKMKEEVAAAQQAVGKANGGLIYASNGTLVNFKPRGTDTVPAMLTPGEFVVNRKATQKNLPLLKSINSGQSSGGNYAIGGVVNSGTPTLDQNTINRAVANTINQFGSTLDNVDKNTTSTRKDISKLKNNNRLFSKGGVVYASKGQLIGAQSRGSDTVPAMLTPGEFVVNKKAAQNNMGLLNSINRSKGGPVYLQDGGLLPDLNSKDFKNGIFNRSTIVKNNEYHKLLIKRKIPHIFKDGGGNHFWDHLGREISQNEYNNLPESLFRIPDTAEGSSGMAFGSSAIRSLAPTGVAMKVGSATTLGLSPFLTPIGGALAGFGAGALAGVATYLLQEKALNTLAPEANQYLKTNENLYPVASMIGSTVGGMGVGAGLGGGLKTFQGGLLDRSAAGAMSTGVGVAIGGVDPLDINSIANAYISGFVQPGGARKAISSSNIKMRPKAILERLRQIPILITDDNGNVLPYDNQLFTTRNRVSLEDFNKSIAYRSQGISDSDTLGLYAPSNGFNSNGAIYIRQSNYDTPIGRDIIRHEWIHGLVDSDIEAGPVIDYVRKNKKYPFEVKSLTDVLKSAESLVLEEMMAFDTGKYSASRFLTKDFISVGGTYGRRDFFEKLSAMKENLKWEKYKAEAAVRATKKLEIQTALDNLSNNTKLLEFPLEPAQNFVNKLQTTEQSLPRMQFSADELEFPPIDFDISLPQNRSTGGIIYASQGRLINFQPKGTDTVPAMLTPGEFVVNKQATQKNLPLLKSINNGAKGYNNGGVVYLNRGGVAEQLTKELSPQLSQYYGSKLAELSNKWFISNDGGSSILTPNGVNRTQVLDQNKPLFPTTRFLAKIKGGEYALIEAQNGKDAIDLARNVPAFQNLDWKKEKAIPVNKILQKYINQKDKKDQQFFNFYQRELNIAPSLFEKIADAQQNLVDNNVKAFSNNPNDEQTPNDQFKQYAKDPQKKQNILMDLSDRLNWLKLIVGNNNVAVVELTKEAAKLDPNDILLNRYKSLIKTADYQAQAAKSEQNAIEKLLQDQTIFGAMLTGLPSRFGRSRLFNLQDPVISNSLQNIVQTKKYNKGGPVYANKGQLINFQPKGTDTVPAMLTPGEFVVNKKATQQNLPLLQNINNGAQGYSSGGIAYLASGGRTYERQQAAFARQKELQEAKRRQYEEMMQARRDAIAADKAQRQLRSTGNFTYQGNRSTVRPQGPVPTNQAQNANNAQNINKADEFLNKLGTKIDLFGNYVQKLADIKIPDKIQMNIVAEPIQVVITGSAALESMSEGIQQMIASQINQKMGQLWGQTDGALGMNPSTSQSRNE